ADVLHVGDLTDVLVDHVGIARVVVVGVEADALSGVVLHRADLVVAVPAVDLVVAGRLVLPDVEGAGVPGVLPHAHVVLRAGPRVGGQRRDHHPRWYEQGRDRRRDAPPDLGTRHGRHLPL